MNFLWKWDDSRFFCVLGNKFWLIVNYRYLCMELGKSWGVSWGISIPQLSYETSPHSSEISKRRLPVLFCWGVVQLPNFWCVVAWDFSTFRRKLQVINWWIEKVSSIIIIKLYINMRCKYMEKIRVLCQCRSVSFWL